MKKLFASALAVSMAVTGIYTTSYASEDTPMVSVEAQKSNHYISEIEKELEAFFAKYNKEQSSVEKAILLKTTVNELQSKVESYTQLLKVIKHKPQRAEIANKLVALKLKHSVLSSFETKEQEDAPSLLKAVAALVGAAVILASVLFVAASQL